MKCWLVPIFYILIIASATICQADITDGYSGLVFYVSKQRGNDSNSGLSWIEAKKTIGGALEEIEASQAVPPAQIWVSAETQTLTGKADVYDSPSTALPDGISIFGGFDGTESNRWQRNWRRNIITLMGQIAIGSGALDGFTIINPGGTGVVMSSDGNASFGLVSHNIIKQVTTGVRCDCCASPVITNNVITQFTMTGICAEQGLPCSITNNTIVRSGEKDATVGIKLADSYLEECGSTGVAICANIIIGCETGIFAPGQLTMKLQSNNLHDNTTNGPIGSGYIYADPMFVNLSQGDFRLQPTSPCIDRYDTNWEQLDVDCNPRRIDVPDVGYDGDSSPLYDIGAYEYQAPPVVDRGLPPANKVNSSAGASRANFRWADSNPSLLYGDVFTLPSGDWIIDTIRVWAIPSLPGYSSYFLGDHFSKITFYTKDSMGPVLARRSCSLTMGNSYGDYNVRVTPVHYANGEGYERPSGGFDNIWQVDITNLNWKVTGGSNCFFGVTGQPRVDRLWFNAASIVELAGSIYRLDTSNSGGGLMEINFSGPLSAWLGRLPNGSVTGSDINVQVFAHKQ